MAVRIPDGFRAVAVKIDESAGVAGWIKPGSRVDVVVLLENTDRTRNESISKVILQNVEVLAVGQDLGKPSDTAATVTKTVTLLLSPVDVPRLHLAETKGKLRLAMRNQHDSSTGRTDSTSDNDLLTMGTASQTGVSSLTSAFLHSFLSGQAKMHGNQTDKDQQAEAEPAKVAAAPVPPPWAVDVYRGAGPAETVRFKRDATEWRPAEGQQHGPDSPAPAAPAAKPFSLLSSPRPTPAPALADKP